MAAEAAGGGGGGGGGGVGVEVPKMKYLQLIGINRTRSIFEYIFKQNDELNNGERMFGPSRSMQSYNPGFIASFIKIFTKKNYDPVFTPTRERVGGRYGYTTYTLMITFPRDDDRLGLENKEMYVYPDIPAIQIEYSAIDDKEINVTFYNFEERMIPILGTMLEKAFDETEGNNGAGPSPKQLKKNTIKRMQFIKLITRGKPDPRTPGSGTILALPSNTIRKIAGYLGGGARGMTRRRNYTTASKTRKQTRRRA
jgi:hypothetical protein